MIGFFLFFVIGIAGGILGGMGMGGGTVLIPLLTFICGVSQRSAQALNLLAFLPMACFSLFVLYKKGLLEFSYVGIIIVSGLITCLIGTLLSKELSGDFLKRAFGGFLIALSVVQFFTAIKEKKNQ